MANCCRDQALNLLCISTEDNFEIPMLTLMHHNYLGFYNMNTKKMEESNLPLMEALSDVELDCVVGSDTSKRNQGREETEPKDGGKVASAKRRYRGFIILSH